MDDGLVEPGNIDLAKRPVVANPDGSYSTVRSIGVNIDGVEVLLPTVAPDGRTLTPQQAIALFEQTGQHLGKFSTVDAANKYAVGLHNAQAQQYAQQAQQMWAAEAAKRDRGPGE